MAQPMNASSSHPKVKVSLTLGKAIYVAGGNITGKLEMECRADQGLGISAMRVELFAIQGKSRLARSPEASPLIYIL